MYFFPVSVFAALTVTPGSGVLPDFTKPVISPNGAETVVAEDSADDVAASGGAGWGVGEDCASTGVGVLVCANKMSLAAKKISGASAARRDGKSRVREQFCKVYLSCGAPPQILSFLRVSAPPR